MNLFEIFDDIQKVDPEFNDRISPRRDAIKNMTGFGKKLALAATPFALNLLLKKAYGQTPSATVLATLNTAYKLEAFGSAFWRTALASTTLTIPAADRTSVLTRIRDNENAHANFLKTTLGTNAVTPQADSTYDFTARGKYPNVLTDYTTFLAVAQVLEDTEVRAYKGQAPNLLGSQTFLTAALNIHSVEARHASALRYLRRNTIAAAAATKPWITGSTSVFNDTGDARNDANYTGENTTTQGGVDITKLPGATTGSTISVAAAVESFDEPLTTAQVTSIVAQFNVML